MSIVVTQIKKNLSTTFVKAQSLCIINRLSYVGEGARAAAGRRDLASRVEEGRRRDHMPTIWLMCDAKASPEWGRFVSHNQQNLCAIFCLEPSFSYLSHC